MKTSCCVPIRGYARDSLANQRNTFARTAIHAGTYFSARGGGRGHLWCLASRKLYASVSETFLTGAHGI
jgi:hypothetical protein